jgi:hypothetical protein
MLTPITEKRPVFETDHSYQAEYGTGKRIQHAENPIEQQTGHDDTYDTDRGGLFPSIFIQRDHCDDIGDAKFDTRYARIIWYNSLNIREYESQRGHEGDPRHELSGRAAALW